MKKEHAQLKAVIRICELGLKAAAVCGIKDEKIKQLEKILKEMRKELPKISK